MKKAPMKKAPLAAVAVFGALLVLFLATRETQVSVGMKKLEVPAFEKAKIVEVDVSGAKSAVLKHDASGWKVEDPSHPGAHPADDGQVESLVQGFGETRYLDLVTDRTDRHAELEVDDAKGLKVKVVAEGAAPVELIFGKAARGGAYVRQAGKPEVFVAQGRFPMSARRDANSWRKHAILALKVEDLTELTVKPRDAQPYSLAKGADGAWALGAGTQAPAGFRFDASAAQRLVQQLANLSAQDFADAAATDQVLGFSGAHDTVEAKLKDGKAVVVQLGQAVQPAADGGTLEPGSANSPVALRVDGDSQVYLVNSYLKSELSKPLTGLRDLSLLTFDPQKVTRLAVRGAKPVVVEKDGASWKVVEPKALPPGAEFDPNQVAIQLARLKNTRAARMVEPAIPDAQSGLSKPTLVEVTLEDGSRQSLRFGKELDPKAVSKETYVKGAADGALYAINAFEKSRFDAGVDLFKKPPPPPNFAGGGMGNIKGLENLPPDVRRQLEAQLGQRMRGAPPAPPR